MTDKIKQQLADDLAKVMAAVKNSNPDEVQARVSQMITTAKANAAENLDTLKRTNSDADQLITPFVDRVNQSKYTPLIIGGIFIAALAAGIAIGIYL